MLLSISVVRTNHPVWLLRPIYLQCRHVADICFENGHTLNASLLEILIGGGFVPGKSDDSVVRVERELTNELELEV